MYDDEDNEARRCHDPANWNYEDGTPEDGPPICTPEPKHDYPCDHGPCPFLNGGNSAATYFCRDNCGLGVDECGE